MNLLLTMPDSSERAEQELALQITIGKAWMGYPSVEWETACTRALELCRQTGNTSQLSRVLGELSIIHFVRAEHHKACELAEEALDLAQDAGDPLLVILGHWYLGFVLLCLGEFTEAQIQLEHALTTYKPQKHHQQIVSLRGVDGGLSAMAYEACCLWCLGFPDQAQKLSQEALTKAHELGHPFTLADVLSYAGCLFNLMRRDVGVLQENTEQLLQLSNDKVPVWIGTASRFRGEVLVLSGQAQEGIDQLREGIAAYQSMGLRLNIPVTLGSLALALAKVEGPEAGLNILDEAFSIVEQTDERLWETELYRIQAQILLMQEDDAEVEASLLNSIAVARKQNARSWELRATVDLASLLQKQGRLDEARKALRDIYNWFTEGFDTPDMKDARSLIDDLS